VEKSTDGATWSAVISNTGSTSTTYEVTGLTNGTTYYLRVTPMSASVLGAPAVASAIPATLPGRVTNVRAVSRDVGEATVSWTAPTSNGGYPVIGYSIEKSTDGRTWSVAVASTGSATTSYLVSGLAAGQPTQLRIRALTVAGSGSASVAASVTPLALPGAPRSLVISSVSTGVRLTWLAPRSNGGSAITGYRVETSVDGVVWKLQSRSGSSPLSLATAAIDGATLVRISALSAAGVGAYAIASLGGGSVTPPDVPTDLTPQTDVDVPAGESQATIAGKKVSTKVVPDADGTGVTVSAGAQRLSLSGIRADGSKASVGLGGVLRLAPGLKVAVDLRDAPVRTRAPQPQLKVGSTASIYLIGDQTFALGSVKVTGQGIALGQLSVPKTATPGRYVLQVNAFTTTGDVLSLSVGVLLVKPKPGPDGKGGTLTSAVYFKDAASALSSQMKAKLRKMVASIPAGKTPTIVIVGFKPAQDSTSRDHFLAKARAMATQKYLASLGFSANVDVRADGISSHSNWRGRRVVVTITF
jgi:outer membrane protein OmpA-like peptidoglycan-associated protein